jgi:hypothetical protein
MAVMWIFYMETALRVILFGAGLLLLIALQAFLLFVMLFFYRQGRHWTPAEGVAAEVFIIWVIPRQIRAFQRRHPDWHPACFMSFGWCVCNIVICAAIGLTFTAWSAIAFALTGEMMQLCIAVLGTGLLALCTTAPIRSCNGQRAPIDAVALHS